MNESLQQVLGEHFDTEITPSPFLMILSDPANSAVGYASVLKIPNNAHGPTRKMEILVKTGRVIASRQRMFDNLTGPKTAILIGTNLGQFHRVSAERTTNDPDSPVLTIDFFLEGPQQNNKPLLGLHYYKDESMIIEGRTPDQSLGINPQADTMVHTTLLYDQYFKCRLDKAMIRFGNPSGLIIPGRTTTLYRTLYDDGYQYRIIIEGSKRDGGVEIQFPGNYSPSHALIKLLFGETNLQQIFSPEWAQALTELGIKVYSGTNKQFIS